MASSILNDQDDDYNEDEGFEDEGNIPRESDNKSGEEEEMEELEEDMEENDVNMKNEEFEEEEVEDDVESDELDNDEDQAVTVLVRIRPLLEDELYTPEGEKATVAVSLPHENDRNKVRVIAKEGTQFESILECGYDRVLDMNTTQTEVFETTAIKPAVLGVAHGISACVFAYGQTSSGKTHTMLGNDEYGRADKAEMNSISDEEWGVIPRAVSCLFGELDSIYSKHIAESVNQSPSTSKANEEEHGNNQSPKNKGSFQFTVYCSMLQIYNEQLHDLLSSSALYGDGEPLKIRETEKQDSSDLYDTGGNTELYVSGLSSFRVSKVEDVLSLLKHGARCRAVRATEWNEVSSRSHAILQLLVETQTKDANGVVTVRRGKLSMVDLAGSEKMNVAKDAPTMSKRHLQELTSINKSLSCLGNVIAVLADKSSGKIPSSSHVPYRDSKLTRLLQDSLGGSTRTVVIACVCPASQHGPESISTLKFADRARRVMARICANEVVNDSTLLARAKLEIKRLQKIINMLRAREASNGGGGVMSNEGGRAEVNDVARASYNTSDMTLPGMNQTHNIQESDGDVYTRQLRIDNLKLKDENRKLKEKVRKMKSKKSLLGSDYLPQHDPSSGYLNYNDAKSVTSVKRNSGSSDLYNPPASVVMKLGQRVETLEMKRRLENEFNNPILPPKLTPFLNKYQNEYSKEGDDEDNGDDTVLGIDMQINILKSMNSKIERKSSLEVEEDGESCSTEKEVKMLDMLMRTHQELRKEAFQEGDKLVSLRSEREELERQLQRMKGGDTIEEASCEEKEEEDVNNETALFETRSPKKKTQKESVDKVQSAPHSIVGTLAGGLARSNSVSGPKQGKRSKKKKKVGRSSDDVATSSAVTGSVLSSSVPIKVGVKPLIVGLKGEADKNGLFHSARDIGVVVKLYSYRFDDYFPATISAYDSNRKLHACDYHEAGDTQWHDLTRKRLVVVSRPLSKENDIKDTVKADILPDKSPDKSTHETIGIKMPPSIFGVRPSSKGANRSRPSSSNKMTREEASELLKNSPYLEAKTPRTSAPTHETIESKQTS